MRYLGTLGAPNPGDLTTYLDQMAGAEYRASRAGQPAGSPAVYGELWLIAVLQPNTGGTTTWQVWAFTSNDDIPGWPGNTSAYLGGIRSAADIARPLAAAGNTVALRRYSSFAVTSTATDVPLT
ncbi:hypothetical protein [Kitasatospora sp. NPDC094011]|uniref:hypothetical protein n=1 Tax=Kitasatospora sp. NPDC094011 TaxID=3364090 RepID=UPI003823E123